VEVRLRGQELDAGLVGAPQIPPNFWPPTVPVTYIPISAFARIEGAWATSTGEGLDARHRAVRDLEHLSAVGQERAAILPQLHDGALHRFGVRGKVMILPGRMAAIFSKVANELAEPMTFAKPRGSIYGV
jgi:hypothetical protein